MRVAASYHHNHVKLALFDAVLAKRFPDDSFYAVPVTSSGKRFFAYHYSKPGVFLAVTHKKNLEVPIGNTFGTDDMVKTVFAQQPMRGGKLGRRAKPRGRYAKPRVWHGP